jgi:hypothetical protein
MEESASADYRGGGLCKSGQVGVGGSIRSDGHAIAADIFASSTVSKADSVGVGYPTAEPLTAISMSSTRLLNASTFLSVANRRQRTHLFPLGHVLEASIKGNCNKLNIPKLISVINRFETTDNVIDLRFILDEY